MASARAATAQVIVLLVTAAWGGCGDDGGRTEFFRTGANDPADNNPDAGGSRRSRVVSERGSESQLPVADEVVELAFGAETVRHRIEILATPAAVDVHINVDTTASIGAEIDALQQGLTTTVTSGLRERVADASFGISRFEDFPRAPYGFDGIREGQDARADTPFELVTPITSELERVESAVATLDRPLGEGGDSPESWAEAIYQIASGEGYRSGGEQLIEPWKGVAAVGGGSGGGVGFREDTLRVLLQITDAPAHDPDDYLPHFAGTRSLQDAAEAALLAQVRVVGIATGACVPTPEEPCEQGRASEVHRLVREQLEALAHRTEATIEAPEQGACPGSLTGAGPEAQQGRCPLVFDAAQDGSGLSETLVEALVTLIEDVRFERVAARVADDPIGFVRTVEAIAIEQEPGLSPAETADLEPEDAVDGIEESFVGVRPGTRMVFELGLQNTQIAPASEPQSFRLRIRIEGDAILLEERLLRVVVPPGPGPAPPPPGVEDGLDAGA
ncbi:MAG: hypothetical protein OEZ06_15180 [Myxococcales bacterium]|nr:hypothetical protein [Myxococcales bacterium]